MWRVCRPLCPVCFVCSVCVVCVCVFGFGEGRGAGGGGLTLSNSRWRDEIGRSARSVHFYFHRAVYLYVICRSKSASQCTRQDVVLKNTGLEPRHLPSLYTLSSYIDTAHPHLYCLCSRWSSRQVCTSRLGTQSERRPQRRPPATAPACCSAAPPAHAPSLACVSATIIPHAVAAHSPSMYSSSSASLSSSSLESALPCAAGAGRGASVSIGEHR